MNCTTNKWKRVSRHTPCAICGKCDWCLFTGPADAPTAAICARIESETIVGTEGAGWLHRLRDDPSWRDRPRQRRMRVEAAADPAVLFEDFAGECVLALSAEREQQLSESLGVSWRSLNQLQMGWSHINRAYSFPMRDCDHNPRGIRFRAIDGRKWSLRGGREGLFIPVDLVARRDCGMLLICEGPTDTAALVDLGFDVVGRPSCNGGAGLLLDLVCDWKPPSVAIIADSDGPGQRGARSLASRLVGYVPDGVRIATPPAKDVREWVRAGATRRDVLDLIDAAPLLQLRYGVKGGVR